MNPAAFCRDSDGARCGVRAYDPQSGKIAVLVTSLDEQAFLTQVIPKHYRYRAGAGNCFDELKN